MRLNKQQLSIRFGFSVLALGLMTACTSVDNQGYEVKKSILEGELETEPLQVISAADENNGNGQQPFDSDFKTLKSLHDTTSAVKTEGLSESFSEQKQIRFAVDSMSPNDFVHYIFGELLEVNYSVSESVTSATDKITMNIQKQVTEKQLFELAESELSRIGVTLAEKESTFYLHRPEGAKDALQIGVGRSTNDIPTTESKILQIVPINFGISTSLERTLTRITDADITTDVAQSVVYVQGDYASVQRTLEMVQMLDQPVNRGKYVGLIRLKYLTPEQFVEDIKPLLEGEGIPAGAPSASESKTVILVPMQQQGYVAVFAGHQRFTQRVEYWAEQIDKPPQGSERRYFIYAPQFARAKDLGQSLQPLLGQISSSASSEGNSSRDTRSAVGSESTSNNDSASRVTASNDDIRMVVDERSNLIIFNTSGREYELLLPLIERLDVMPRQIILEATIAEVTLTDEFRMGVEWALERGDWGASTSGAFGVEDLGGIALDYMANTDMATARALQSNNLVNVLSNPTLLVRDGTSANITVGTEIPIVTSTVSDPFEGNGAVQQNIQRRQTGLTFDVTPTINSQGVVIMQINQTITNQTGSGSSNSPTLFNRSISTEVVANSGQTIILGGLISEDSSDGSDGVPGLSRLPLLGNLFKTETRSKTKTELVIMVTPKIIDNQRQWDRIRKDFAAGLKNVNIVE